jgi:hypothetical protein
MGGWYFVDREVQIGSAGDRASGRKCDAAVIARVLRRCELVVDV